jgi:hypothetical protein
MGKTGDTAGLRSGLGGREDDRGRRWWRSDAVDLRRKEAGRARGGAGERLGLRQGRGEAWAVLILAGTPRMGDSGAAGAVSASARDSARRRTRERWAGPVGPQFGALCTKAQCTVSRLFISLILFSFLFNSLLF